LLECNEAIGQLLSISPSISQNISVYESNFQRFQKIYDYIQLYCELNSLRKKESLNNISQLSELLEKLEKEFLDASKKYIEALGRYRIINLSNEDRKTLTNYYSVVKSLSGEYP